MNAFITFFNDHLSTLEQDYQWPKRVPKNKPDAPWRFETNGAAECIAMKEHLTDTWAKADVAGRSQLARWIVSDWGGVHANTPETLAAHIATVTADPLQTPLSGVASYSKILSVVDCTRYAIYDARVAACLNAVQLLHNTPNPQFFPLVPSRNTKINAFMRWFQSEKQSNYAKATVSRDKAYGAYCQLLHDLKSHFPGQEIYHFEMTLFNKAPDICAKAMQTQ